MTNISEKQLEANKRNAKLGGIKTEEGKAISRYNAIKHGILSQEVLLEGEDEKTLVELGKRLRSELEPKSELELVLVDRITANVWRLRRVMQIEREIMTDQKEDAFSDDIKNIGQAVSIDLANRDTYGKLMRYETAIEKGIYKALHELQRIQASRAGGNPPLPIAIDLEMGDE